jgi:hypothetical protein
MIFRLRDLVAVRAADTAVEASADTSDFNRAGRDALDDSDVAPALAEGGVVFRKRRLALGVWSLGGEEAEACGADDRTALLREALLRAMTDLSNGVLTVGDPPLWVL